MASGKQGNVSVENLPHARKQLDQSTITICKRHDNVRRRLSRSVHVQQAQDKRSQGKSRKTQGRRVREFTVLDRLEQPRLHFTSKSCQALTIGLGGVCASEGVAAVVIRATCGRSGGGVVAAAVVVGLGSGHRGLGLLVVRLGHVGGVVLRHCAVV